MGNMGNVVVVLFNPPKICIDDVLGFISVFSNTQSKLHILSDLENGDRIAKEEDLLILELSLPKNSSLHLLEFVENYYPLLNTFVFDKSEEQNRNINIGINASNTEQVLAFNNYSFNLN